MIEAHDLSRSYGDFTAVDGIDFSVQEGEIVGILGPNGAGKTTTIRMTTGFLPPTRGQVLVNGLDLFREPAVARRQIGYLPENVALYKEMRVREYLGYRARLEGLQGSAARTAVCEALDRCLLSDVVGQVIGTLSKGFRQRVGLATAILHRPKVLVLDEPTVGLDPKQIIAIRQLIRELGQESTLLISTHILPEVELLCSRVLIIDRGRLVAQGPPNELVPGGGRGEITLQVKGEPAGVGEVLEGLDGVTTVTRRPGEGAWSVRTDGGDVREEIFRAAVANRWVLLEMAQRKASLEELFVRLTTHEPSEDDRAQEVPS